MKFRICHPLGSLPAALATLLLLSAAPAGARTVTVRPEIKVSTYSWYPLPLPTISRIVEGRVLQILTRSGKLTFLPSSGGAEKEDVKLEVTARIIEDAAQFSVFINAVPRRQEQAGSMASVATHSIKNKTHKGIQLVMEQAADEAGGKMEELLAPYLDVIAADAQLSKIVPMEPEKMAEVNWAGALSLKGGPGAGLPGAGNIDAFAARAQKEGGARLALAHCALAGGQPGMQTRCVDALAQLSRDHPSAQRALIQLLFSPPPARRTDEWEKARQRAFRITTSFSGAALQEAVQAWLFILASDHSDNYQLFGGRREDYVLADPISRYLERNPQVPNLDRALAFCSRPAKKKDAAPDQYCLRVMKSVPVGRRLALLYNQLSGPVSYTHGEEWKGWTGMLETVVDRGKPLHPAVEEICKQRVMRSYWAVDRKDCLEALGKQGKPTPALLDFLMQVFLSADSEINFRINDALRDLLKRDPALCPRYRSFMAPRAARLAFPMFYPRDHEASFLKFCKE